MSKGPIPILLIICMAAGVLFLVRTIKLASSKTPLENVTIPSLPTTSLRTEAKEAPTAQAKPSPPASRLTPANSGPVPPEIAERVNTIKESEVFGPVPRPLPMALLGIAGANALVRAPNGQTGLLKVGEELGGVRLLQISTNRVLIEHEGQEKELTIFSGFGSSSLIPPRKDPPQ